ncbi:UDP-glycosyltransferase 83A1 [Glycine max]|nr:UDP-glycosyltransferase 83A1 [Glycine max]
MGVGGWEKIWNQRSYILPIAATMFALLCNSPKLIDDGIINSDGSLLTTKKTIRLSPNMPRDEPRNIFLVKYAWHKRWYEYDAYYTNFKFDRMILPIGPLLNTNNATARSLGKFHEEDLSCMSWLDQQPHCSVTYVAFGSISLFDQNQFNELALALDLANGPFLWVVRQDNKMAYPYEFQGQKGKIVGWAPQQKVLSHPAIACFFSHCGWNSTIEGLSSGVPFLCWPYFADQIYNKTYICDELKVGLGLNSNESGFVSRLEIRNKLDQLLSDENIRSRSLKLKEELMNNKGLSSDNLNKFVKWLKE